MRSPEKKMPDHQGGDGRAEQHFIGSGRNQRPSKERGGADGCVHNLQPYGGSDG